MALKIDAKRRELLKKLKEGDRITLMANKKEGWKREVVEFLGVEEGYDGMILVEKKNRDGSHTMFEVHIEQVEVQ